VVTPPVGDAGALGVVGVVGVAPAPVPRNARVARIRPAPAARRSTNFDVQLKTTQ
jgi:hypothetical protein